MPLPTSEELKLQIALMEIKKERKRSLNAMFQGTQLILKSKLNTAKEAKQFADDAKKLMKKVPGIKVPSVDINMPALNVDLFKGIDLRKLTNIPNIPGLRLPNFDLGLIPDISLGSLPGFNLPTLRINLKGILKYKDLFPKINLRALIWVIGMKCPHLSIPSLVFDLGALLKIDLPSLIPKLPKISIPDLNIELPNLKLPDVNLPITIPPNFDVDLNWKIHLPSIKVPGLDIGKLLKIPVFDKVLKLLFELFDICDISIIIGELGLKFISDFVGSALPIVQQVKS